MAGFLSTQNTAAFCGGFKYKPIMPVPLLSKSGLLLAIYQSSRRGFSWACLRTRCTVDLLTPRNVNQCGTSKLSDRGKLLPGRIMRNTRRRNFFRGNVSLC